MACRRPKYISKTVQKSNFWGRVKGQSGSVSWVFKACSLAIIENVSVFLLMLYCVMGNVYSNMPSSWALASWMWWWHLQGCSPIALGTGFCSACISFLNSPQNQCRYMAAWSGLRCIWVSESTQKGRGSYSTTLQFGEENTQVPIAQMRSRRDVS